ncbi:hypothetical protein X471_00762 [Bartonella bacilliformis str. Heidi Mejia]|uniref:hypothetical protein n=1 Tax=Bartonella bacilliformis TaxID=774 RepID=UPI00044873C3|nr:hypothetical protein [Bartonella bacilliformis]EYS91592.1 hypothetical protein X471_00762 [Bartonella bacilliformis str. Heidi Mejia]KEG16182.1 hypothetical protein H707_01257 [Bartonella bacilliformis Hosp800-02]KEG16226.1 hypothetical protein H707_01252 [Bartonella bacilliformis Hosp800-02]KEG24884.1 hypothetical protein H706_00198 [Bartonella bacilliformis CAR600-02]
MGGLWTMAFLLSILHGFGLVSKKSGDASADESSSQGASPEGVVNADVSSIADALTTPEAVSTADAVSTTVEVFSTFV